MHNSNRLLKGFRGLCHKLRLCTQKNQLMSSSTLMFHLKSYWVDWPAGGHMHLAGGFIIQISILPKFKYVLLMLYRKSTKRGREKERETEFYYILEIYHKHVFVCFQRVCIIYVLMLLCKGNRWCHWRRIDSKRRW